MPPLLSKEGSHITYYITFYYIGTKKTTLSGGFLMKTNVTEGGVGSALGEAIWNLMSLSNQPFFALLHHSNFKCRASRTDLNLRFA